MASYPMDDATRRKVSSENAIRLFGGLIPESHRGGLEGEDLAVARHGDFARVMLTDRVLPFGVGQIRR